MKSDVVWLMSSMHDCRKSAACLSLLESLGGSAFHSLCMASIPIAERIALSVGSRRRISLYVSYTSGHSSFVM